MNGQSLPVAGCSTGPQLPLQVTVTSVAWYAVARAGQK